MDNQREDKLTDLQETLREIRKQLEAIPAICDKWLKDDDQFSRSTTS